MCDDVPRTWLPTITYQGLCATGSEKLLVPTAVGICNAQHVCISQYDCIGCYARSCLAQYRQHDCTRFNLKLQNSLEVLNHQTKFWKRLTQPAVCQSQGEGQALCTGSSGVV